MGILVSAHPNMDLKRKLPEPEKTNDGDGSKRSKDPKEKQSCNSDELNCKICSELFVKAITLNCAHTFCKFCITKWNVISDRCPLCREMIATGNATLVIDNLVQDIVDKWSDDMKNERKRLCDQRTDQLELEPHMLFERGDVSADHTPPPNISPIYLHEDDYVVENISVLAESTINELSVLDSTKSDSEDEEVDDDDEDDRNSLLCPSETNSSIDLTVRSSVSEEEDEGNLSNISTTNLPEENVSEHSIVYLSDVSTGFHSIESDSEEDDVGVDESDSTQSSNCPQDEEEDSDCSYTYSDFSI